MILRVSISRLSSNRVAVGYNPIWRRIEGRIN